MTAPIQVTTRNRVTHLHIDRPEKRNALTAAMYQALADGLKNAAADPSVRAVLILGHTNCFSAGNDLKDFLEQPHEDDASPVSQFLRTIATFEKPLVAAVGGPAVGVGTTMLLHCDLVYATPEARFQLPFVHLGLVPEAGSGFLLPRIAGYQRAAELMLLGRPFSAETAVAAGFVTAIVDEHDLFATAIEAAEAVAALPPESVRMTKALMKRHTAPVVADQMAAESRQFRERLHSPEAKEAFTAFLEKRPADFSKF